MGFLSNLTPNLEKFSAFGEIASLKKHYEKFTIKNSPPLYSDLGEYRGGILIRGGILNRNCPDIYIYIYVITQPGERSGCVDPDFVNAPAARL